MKARKKRLFVLALLIGLGALTPVLSGCTQDEEHDKDPNYYTGKDFKGHGAGGQTTEQPAKTAHLRGGE